ncbi:hypothetical protein [Victivallis sp. Marseille-Q1083]|uniref:hypothetical protein n=1 Tax=Victivallis sp. Marseille-Q1083 TaxID=2717288 RepID=UPI00158DF40C|nr:hypothetical protein [Victivallis sp. Marseille-Q1083]
MQFFKDFGQLLSGAHSFYLFLAVVGTAIFAIQFIMSLVGLHGGDDLSLDAPDSVDINPDAATAGDLANLNFFSMKSIVAFITFFGWGGVFWGDKGWSGLLLAFICGSLMLVLTSLVIYLMLKLQQSGNIDNRQFLGCNGIVYLTIPGGSESGKVTVALPNCTRQIKALADELLPTGTPVKIQEIIGGDCFRVSRLEEPPADSGSPS